MNLDANSSMAGKATKQIEESRDRTAGCKKNTAAANLSRHTLVDKLLYGQALTPDETSGSSFEDKFVATYSGAAGRSSVDLNLS